eukprot:496726_1
MANTLQSIVTETDDPNKCELYKTLLDELTALDSTLQENDFLENNICEILSVLRRDTDITTHSNSMRNNKVSARTLYHIIPVLGFALNLSPTFTAHTSALTKLCFNALNIIRDTIDLELCVRCLWMFKSIVLPSATNMKSFLALFYESTFQFLSKDTNRFLSEISITQSQQHDSYGHIKMAYMDRVSVLHVMTLRSYLNLYPDYKLLMNKSSEWLHLVVPFLLSDHEELQKVTIEFLMSFIQHIKALDDPHGTCTQYKHFNRYFSSNHRLLDALKSLIGTKNSDQTKTIFKLKQAKNNDTINRQTRNIKLWSVMVHCLALNISCDQKIINRLLNFIKTYFTSNPLLAFKYFADLIFVFNLDPKRLGKKQTLSLFYKVFDCAFKGKRTLTQQLECLKTWFYGLSALAKHKLLFKNVDGKGLIPFKKIGIPLFNIAIQAQTSNDRTVLSRNIIVFMTELVRKNDKKAAEDEKTPSNLDDIEMKDVVQQELMGDIVDMDANVIHFEWQFEYWSVSLLSMLKFAHNMENNEVRDTFCKVLLDTFFGSVVEAKKGTQNEKLQTRYLNRYLEQITVFVATNCSSIKHDNWQSLEHIAGLLEIYFKNTAKYDDNIRKLKLKPLHDSEAFGNIKLTQCGDTNVMLFLMTLWITKCESLELFPFSGIYQAFIERITDNNDEDVVYVLDMYQNLTQTMLCILTKTDTTTPHQTKETKHLCRTLSFVFRQVFYDLQRFKVINEETTHKILSIYRSFIEFVFQFISICDFKVMFSDASDEQTAITSDFTSFIVPNIGTMICKVLNGNYDKENNEWIAPKDEAEEDAIFMHKPDLNALIRSIHESVKDKDCNSLQDPFKCVDLVWIKFGYLWLQFMCKSTQHWYHELDNKAMFKFIIWLFIYIIHQTNHNASVSVEWITEAKHFIESFNSFLGSLSMTHYVNLWSQSISNHLFLYVQNEYEATDVNEYALAVNQSICQCFATYIRITCHYASVVKHKQKQKRNTNSDNIHTQFIQLLHRILTLSSGDKENTIWRMMRESCIEHKMKHIFKIMNKTFKNVTQMETNYPLLVQIMHQQKEREKHKEEQQKAEEKEKEQEAPKKPKLMATHNKATPITINKPSMISTRSRRRSNRKKSKECAVYLDDSQHEKLTYSETQMSFD